MAQTPDSTGKRRDDEGPPDEVTDIPKAGWIEILKRAYREFKHDDVVDYAAALTHYGVLSLFPAMLVLVSLLGLMGKADTDKVLSNVDALAPGAVRTFLSTVIQQVQGRAGLSGAVAIAGVAVALWSASGYVAAFMRAMNNIYGVDEGRPFIQKTALRLGTTVAMVVITLIALAIVVFTGPVAEQAGRLLGIGQGAALVWDILKWPLLLAIVSFMFALLYRVTPNVEQPGLRWISPGGVLAVLIWVVASAGFALYVSFSDSYNKTYGTVATVIIFVIWLWIANIAILLGAEFNAEVQRERAIQAGMPPDLEPFPKIKDTRKLDDERKAEAERAEEIRERTMTGDVDD